MAADIDASTLRKVEEYIEQEEGAQHRFPGAWGTFLYFVAVAMSLFHLYAAYGNVTTTTLRYAHVAFVLFLSFTLFPWRKQARHRFSWIDLAAALLGVATLAYAVWGGDDFLDRSLTALATASERVRVKFGFACTSAMATSDQLRASAAAYAPGQHVTVLAMHPPLPATSSPQESR